jgi:hypothetical protein
LHCSAGAGLCTPAVARRRWRPRRQRPAGRSRFGCRDPARHNDDECPPVGLPQKPEHRSGPFPREYELTYSDDDLPTHYAFKVASRLDAIDAEYQRLLEAGPTPSIGTERRRPRLSRSLAEQARRAIEGLDERGAWVEAGRLRSLWTRPGPSTCPVSFTRRDSFLRGGNDYEVFGIEEPTEQAGC